MKELISDGKLFAYADDIIIEAKDIDELRKIIGEFKKLKSWGLNINLDKSMVLANKKNSKKFNKIEGVKVKDCVKYLGINLSFNKKTLKDLLKKNTSRKLENTVLTLRNVNSTIRNKISKSIVESSL